MRAARNHRGIISDLRLFSIWQREVHGHGHHGALLCCRDGERLPVVREGIHVPTSSEAVTEVLLEVAAAEILSNFDIGSVGQSELLRGAGACGVGEALIEAHGDRRVRRELDVDSSIERCLFPQLGAGDTTQEEIHFVHGPFDGAVDGGLTGAL